MTELEKLKMDDEYISQNDIVKRYLHNKLTPEETVEFEEYMLDKAELLERLELDSVLVRTLPEVAAKSITTSNKKVSWWSPVISNLVAITACSALFIVTYLGDFGGGSEVFEVSPNLVYLDNYRSLSPEIKIEFLTNENEKILVLGLPLGATGTFSITAIAPETNLTHKIGSDLTPNSESELIVVLEKEELNSGLYEFVVEQKKDPRFTANYKISLSK